MLASWLIFYMNFFPDAIKNKHKLFTLTKTWLRLFKMTFISPNISLFLGICETFVFKMISKLSEF